MTNSRRAFSNLVPVHLATFSLCSCSIQIPRHERISSLQTLAKPLTTRHASLSTIFFPMLLPKHNLSVKTLGKIKNLLLKVCTAVPRPNQELSHNHRPGPSHFLSLESYHEGGGLATPVKTCPHDKTPEKEDVPISPYPSLWDKLGYMWLEIWASPLAMLGLSS